MNRKSVPAVFLAGAVALGLGCGSSPRQLAVPTCTPGVSLSCACPGGTLSTQQCAPDGQSLSLCACGVDSQALGGGGAGSGANGAAGSPLPCDVASILSEHCALCHGATPAFTAPMSLVSWEDLTKPSVVDPTVPTYQRVLARINDLQKPMPQPPNDPLTADQIAVLTNWVNGGAQKGTDASCTNTGTAGTSAGSAGDGAAGDGAAGTGAVDPGEECFDIIARATADKTQKFAVPTTPDTYIAFNYAPPWGSAKVQGIRTETIIDNAAVVHHWILYSNGSAVTDGTHANASGTHPGGQFVVGWAPGAKNMEMPADVGLQLPGAGYQLEIHYNAKAAGQLDSSGVKLCVTHVPRANEAATHPLGKEAFYTSGAGDVTGTCVPRGTSRITIMSSSPHMHLKGTWMKTIIKRANGMTETLIDSAFDFNNQGDRPTPNFIDPGDSLVTTCTFNGAASFGTKTTEEMCYNFVTAYPAGALAGKAGYTGVSGNGNTCINTGF